MTHLFTYMALDIANERARDARQTRRANLAGAGAPQSPGMIRRGTARGLAVVSRATAGAARRLDRGVADDLGRGLATGK